MAANWIHNGTVPTAQQASFSSLFSNKFLQSSFLFFAIEFSRRNYDFVCNKFVFNERRIVNAEREILIQRLKFRLDY